VTDDRRSFPAGFRWGTATAAHQIEGGNWNNDWWEWEHKPGTPCVETSGDACDSWHRWRDDVALCTEMGLDSYRFSIEWSRIEPEDGEWSTAAVGASSRAPSGTPRSPAPTPSSPDPIDAPPCGY
jgi:beta-glucosidase